MVVDVPDTRRIADDSHGSVPRNGTDGLVGLSHREFEPVRTCTTSTIGYRCKRRRPPIRRPRFVAHPNHGRMTWSATAMTRYAIGTAAKNPRAALHPLRRLTDDAPLGCGTNSQVRTLPTIRTRTM